MLRGHSRRCLGINHDRLRIIDDHGRTLNLVASGELGQEVYGRVDTARALKVDRLPTIAFGAVRVDSLKVGLGRFVEDGRPKRSERLANAADTDVVNDDVLVFEDEAEFFFVALPKGRGQCE